MPVPHELKPLFTRLVEKSRQSEVNWVAAERADTFRVTFPDLAIEISQEGDFSLVRVELLNDSGEAAAVITVDDGDEEWIGAVSLINSASRKVTKVDVTVRRAMEELAKDGPIGEGPEA